MNAFIGLGAAAMFIGVALGAFGAHALKRKLSEDKLAVYQTGVLYQLVHGIGLLLIGVAGYFSDSDLLAAAGWLLAAGILLFSGSLYALSLSGIRKLGIVTPIGGLAFLAGWALMAAAFWL
ncbi:DUF423 domain-containing protein [Paenibacillus humicus]|uniref:DUF423 domain-containing protein n=1 Tax=Paenibacillus humicus TaxID=412861 RepID=UPI000FD82978|nr:DUF423 domain-containing protein [Paenibacillus humicus]